VLLVPKELDSAARLGERQTDGSSQANLPLQLFVHAAKERLNLYARVVLSGSRTTRPETLKEARGAERENRRFTGSGYEVSRRSAFRTRDFFVGGGFLFLASALGITRNDLTTRRRLGERPSILELP
jgi:hypothetical protein